MKRRIVLAFVAAALASPHVAFAADPSGHATPSESAFVARAIADLRTRFATPAAARKAGYFRYTDEDDTGAISYANERWTSTDAAHPSQLWYDAKNRLIGADYSVPMDSSTPPHLFGFESQRWQKFSAHVHYGIVGPHGIVYGGAGAKTLAKGGGTIAHPTARELVAAGVAKRVADVKFVFAFPAIWDVPIWLVPNPDGAFAEKNPDLKAAKPGKEMPM